MADEKMKKLSLEDLENISGGIGDDAPRWFLDSIPDDDLAHAWELAFRLPQNFSSWSEYGEYLRNPEVVKQWMEVGKVKGLSLSEFQDICVKVVKIQYGLMEYPTF